MKGKVILFSAMVLLMVFAFAAPVFAFPVPSHGTFTQGVADWIVSPPTEWTNPSGTILYGKGEVDNAYMVGSPWGSATWGPLANGLPSFWYVNIDTSSPAYLTGGGIGSYVEIYAKGTIEYPLFVFSFNGLGYYTYNGPSFTIPSGPFAGTAVTQGEEVFGLLWSSVAVGHGVSGDLRGVVVTEKGSWFEFLSGLNIGVETVTYACP